MLRSTPAIVQDRRERNARGRRSRARAADLRPAPPSLGPSRPHATCSTSCWPTRAAATTCVATVFVECMLDVPRRRPRGMRPVGETEFVNGVAAMSASGGYGPTRVAAGIVSYADLRLGDRGRRRCSTRTWRPARPLPRHPPRRRLGRQRPGPQLAHESAARPARRRRFRRGLRRAGAARPHLRRVALPPAARRS